MPKWLEEEALRQEAADWMMPCEYPCGAVKLLLAHIKECHRIMRELCEDIGEPSGEPHPALEAYDLMNREEPPDVS